jgi:hypothetical protein
MVRHPLRCFPRRSLEVTKHYGAYILELLVINHNLMRGEPYLGNRHTSLYTDHPSLKNFFSQQKHSSHPWRHLDKLQKIDFSIKCIPAAVNPVADALSRIHYPVSATAAATISINAMEPHIVGAEEWKQQSVSYWWKTRI